MEENNKYKMIKCPHCQKDVMRMEEGDHTCPYCGKSLDENAGR